MSQNRNTNPAALSTRIAATARRVPDCEFADGTAVVIENPLLRKTLRDSTVWKSGEMCGSSAHLQYLAVAQNIRAANSSGRYNTLTFRRSRANMRLSECVL